MRTTVDARGRITNALLDLCREPAALTHPDGMQLKVSRQELARIAGTHVEIRNGVVSRHPQDMSPSYFPYDSSAALRALRRKARTLSWSFRPGCASTPPETGLSS